MRNWLKLLCGCSFFIMALAPTDPIDKILAAFMRYAQEMPQEKIYLHINQSSFFGGEPIWFKAYLAAGPQNVPSPLSRTVYVDLINSKNKLISQIKLYNLNGSVSGNLQIPDTLTPGNYMIRAYTHWMKNFSEDYFFHRSVKILSVFEAKRTSAAPALDVQFFPESGQWVNGFKNKLAFKAIDENGFGKKISGKILEDSGKEVANFQSNFLGMGYCELTPQKGHAYRAVLEEPSIEIKLPEALESGVTLFITNKPDQEFVVVRIQNNTPQKEFYLVAQCRGLVNYISKVSTPAPIAFVKIPKEELATGIIQITLVTDANVPVAERLIFNDRKNALAIQVTADKEIYAPREKVTLQIEVRDSEGNPVASDLSLAVTDDNQTLTDKDHETIFSYLYFASDLTGWIESSGYYFNPENTDRHEFMEALLLTQGWRRFSYESVVNDSIPPPSFMPEQGLTIKGVMIDQSTKKPAPKGTVKYLNTYPIPEVKLAASNEAGQFEISPVVFFDSSRVILQGKNRRGETNMKFILDSLPNFVATHLTVPSALGLTQEAERKLFLEGLNRKDIRKAYNFDTTSILLDAVEIASKKEESSTASMKRVFGTPSASLTVADNPVFENYLHPLQVLQGRVAGVQVTGSGNDWNVLIRGVNTIISGTVPLIMINNGVTDITGLNAINPRDIESISVYKGADTAIFGNRGTNGVIIVYLKPGSNRFSSSPSSKTFTGGYQTFRRFYSPQYDAKSSKVKPDHRSTLFWAPNIKTDTSGRTSVTFFNHDLKTSITGILEGMTSNGFVGSQTMNYTIKK